MLKTWSWPRPSNGGTEAEWRYTPLILNLGARWRSVVNITPWRLWPMEIIPVATEEEAGWGREYFWTVWEKITMYCSWRDSKGHRVSCVPKKVWKTRKKNLIIHRASLPNLLIHVHPSGHYMYHQFNIHNSTFCPRSVFMCFVWISEQTAIISLYSINWLVFITKTECVYCAVRTGSLYIILRSAHTVYLCVLCGSEKKQRLFPYTALTDWFL